MLFLSLTPHGAALAIDCTCVAMLRIQYTSAPSKCEGPHAMVLTYSRFLQREGQGRQPGGCNSSYMCSVVCSLACAACHTVYQAGAHGATICFSSRSNPLPCRALHYTICGHVVYCIIPHGATASLHDPIPYHREPLSEVSAWGPWGDCSALCGTSATQAPLK